MTTIQATIIYNKKRQNNSWVVYYKITHHNESHFIKTKHIAGEKDLLNESEVHLDYIIDHLAVDLKKYRQIITSIEEIENLSMKEVIEKITYSQEIDLMPFFKEYIEKLNLIGKRNSAMPLTAVYNSLKDFNGKKLLAPDLTSNFLMRYEEFLRTPKTQIRINQFGKKSTFKNKFLTDRGVHNHMSNLRILFNAARFHYNDEDVNEILIKNYPFKKYKIKPKRNVRYKSIGIADIKRIVSFHSSKIQEQLAKDIFMLSFYLCGMNTVDIYNNIDRLLSSDLRIEYNRAKTKAKRKDEAFISVRIPEEARYYINSLKDIRTIYSTPNILSSSISKGLRKINETLNIENLVMYSARHSFATIARNDCGISKDDIALALNHIDPTNRVTDIYIKPDWSIVDRVQDAVLNGLRAVR